MSVFHVRALSFLADERRGPHHVLIVEVSDPATGEHRHKVEIAASPTSRSVRVHMDGRALTREGDTAAAQDERHAADCMSRFGGDCTCWLRRRAAASGEGNTDG